MALFENINLSALSNTTNASTTTIQLSNLAFIGAGGASVGFSNGSIIISGANGGGGGLAISAGTQSGNTGTIIFSNSNNMSFGMSNNSVITGSFSTFQSIQPGIQSIQVSNATYTTGNIIFSNANGVTFGSSAGGAITASIATNYQSQGAYLTTAAQSNQVVNGINGSTGQISLNVGSSLSSSINGSSITLGLASNITTALQSAGAYLTTADLSANSSNYIRNWKLTGNTSGTTSSAQGTDFWLGGGNGVTVSGSSNSISFSVATNYQSQGAYLTTAMQTGSQSQLWIMGNSSATVGGTNVSGTMYSNGLSLSAAAGGGGGGPSIADINGHTITNGTIVFSNSNGFNFGLNGSTLTMTQAPMSYYEPNMRGASSSKTMANGTVYFQPFFVSEPVSMYRMNFLGHVTSISATTLSISGSISSQTSSGGTNSWGQTGTVLLFSRVSTGTNINSSNIISFYSNSFSNSVGIYVSASWSTNVSSATVSYSTTGSAGYISQIDSVGGVTTTVVSSSGSTSFSSTSTTRNSFSSSTINSFLSNIISGMRGIVIPFATSLQSGEYWMGVIYSSTNGSTYYNHSNNVRAVISIAGQATFTNTNYLEYGNTVTMNNSNVIPGWGSYSASSLTSTTIPLSNITVQGGFQTWFNFMAQTK